MAPSFATVLVSVFAGCVMLNTFNRQILVGESVTGTVVYILTIYILGSIIYHVWLYPYYLTPFKNLPQMNLTGRFMNRRDIEASFVEFANSPSRKGHNLLRCYMPHAREMLLVLGCEGIADILVRQPYHFEKPEHIKFDLNYLFAKGLFTAEGSEHKALRKRNAPAFAYRHIKNLYPIFWSTSIEMVEEMKRQVCKPDHDGVVKIHDWTTRATLDIIGIAGMGFDFESLKNPDSTIHRHYKRLTGSSRQPHPLLSVARAFGFETLFRMGLSLPSKEKNQRESALENVRQVAARMIQNERENQVSKQESHNIVAVALQNDTVDQEELVDEVMTFIGAGHESTSAALVWAIYSMCCHEAMSTRLRNEVRDCLDKCELAETDGAAAALASKATADKIHRLPYLNAYINEVLRFHPSVPVTLRHTVCDTTIDGVAVPANTAIALPIRAINRDKRLWGPDASQFNPERWLEPGMTNSGGGLSNYANMTFLHGPRSCIGRDFARSELLFLVAALAANFHMELPGSSSNKEPDCVLQITILPKDGLPVRLSPL